MHRRDLCRQLLSQILADDQALQEKRTDLEKSRTQQIDEMKELGLQSELDIDQSASRRFYAGQLSGDMRHIDRDRLVISQQLDLCRKALAQAEQDVKALENVKEKRYREYLYEQEKQEARELEEAWMAIQATEE